MRVTGYKLQLAAKLLKGSMDFLSKQFDANILQFESEKGKLDLDAIFASYKSTELKLATVNHLQAAYNQRVMVNVAGKEMTLNEAIILVGPTSRFASKWAKAEKGTATEAKRPWERDSVRVERDPLKEYAVRAKPFEHCSTRRREAEQYAAAVREAVQIGNATEVDFIQVEPEVFEP